MDLDETLIHLKDEEGEEGSFCYFRPGANNFLKELSKHYEIVIFTAAMPDVSKDKLNLISKLIFSTLIQFLIVWTLKKSGLRTDYTDSIQLQTVLSQCKYS